jgi:hypothetical protein
MKLLMIFCDTFIYEPTVKTLEDFPDSEKGEAYQNALVAFIHAESVDESDIKGIETKLVKNLKWAAKKNDTKEVVLHSFAHLAETKANPSFTSELFNRVEARMKNADYLCSQTAFGYFMNLDIKAPGVSRARIFKSF